MLSLTDVVTQAQGTVSREASCAPARASACPPVGEPDADGIGISASPLGNPKRNRVFY